MTLNFAPLEYATVIRLESAMLEGNELKTPEELVWPSVPTKIASLRVHSGPQRHRLHHEGGRGGRVPPPDPEGEGENPLQYLAFLSFFQHFFEQKR